jgi:hypothetical protein
MAKSPSGPLPNQLWGAAAIARQINRTERQTRHLIEIGALDGCVEKVGGSLVGFSDKLRERFGRLASDPDPFLEPRGGPGRPSQRGARLVTTDTTDAA